MVASKLPTEGILESTFKIKAILDKGSGAVLLVEVLTKDQATQETIVKNQMSVFVVGSGGFNGPRSSEYLIPTEENPDRSPDWEMAYRTNIDQVRWVLTNNQCTKHHKGLEVSCVSTFEKGTNGNLGILLT